MCDLTVQHLNLRLAWVGVPDAEGIFVRVAGSGCLDFLENIKIVTHPGVPEGQDTLGPAWRQAQMIYNPSFATHPTLQRWAARAESYAIHSCASFPLFRQNQCWAIFTIYHHDADFLSAPLQNLLLTLSADIGLGLDALYNKNLQHLMFNHSHAGIALVKDRTILQANAHLSQMTGLPLEQLQGQSTRIVFSSEEDWLRVGAAYPDFQQNTSVKVPSISIFSTAAEPIIADFSGVRLEGYDGLTVWTIEDVSQRVSQENQLQAQSAFQSLLSQIQALFVAGQSDESLLLEQLSDCLLQGFLEVIWWQPQNSRWRLLLQRNTATAEVSAYAAIADSLLQDLQQKPQMLQAIPMKQRQEHSPGTAAQLALLPLLHQKKLRSVLGLIYPATSVIPPNWQQSLMTLNQTINLGFERFWTQQEEHRTHTLNHILLNSLMAGIMVTRYPSGQIEQINTRMQHLLGIADVQQILGQSDQLFIVDAQQALKMADVTRIILQTGSGTLHDLCLRRLDGSVLFTDASGQLLPALDATAEQQHILWTYVDVNERHAYVQKIDTLNQNLNTLLANTTAGINLVRYPDRVIIEANQAFLDILGYPREEIVGFPTRLFYPTLRENERMASLSERILKQGHGQLRNLHILRKEGSSVYVDISGQKINWQAQATGAEEVVVWTSVDVTERHRLATELAHQALFDPLTHLPNRRALEQEFGKMMARAKRNHWLLAVVMLDLDGFKPVNDHYGHETGDEVLQIVSNRLRQTVRSTDFVARLGGDEFVLLIENCQTLEDISLILDKINHSLCEPITTSAAPALHLQASAGLCIYPLNTADNPEVLLRLADQALYENKAHKTDRTRFWTLYGYKTLLQYNEVQQYLHDRQLRIVYQVIYSMPQNRVIGIEALARLIDNTAEEIHPSWFLPHLTVDDFFKLSQQVLQQSIRDMQYIDQVLPGLWLSININPHNLDERSVRYLHDFLIQEKFPFERLHLDISEGIPLENSRHAIDIMHQLKQMGIHLSLDDVGSAYTSLLHIRELPIDIIKLDQAFVRTLKEHTQDLYFIKFVQELANSLNIELIVEGVETAEIMEMVQSLGVQVLQGFAIAVPLPLEALLDYLQHPHPLMNQHTSSLLGIYTRQLTHHNSIMKVLQLNPQLINSEKLSKSQDCPIHQDLAALDVPADHPVHLWHERYHQALYAQAQSLLQKNYTLSTTARELELDQINKKLQEAILELSERPEATH